MSIFPWRKDAEHEGNAGEYRRTGTEPGPFSTATLMDVRLRMLHDNDNVGIDGESESGSFFSRPLLVFLRRCLLISSNYC